MDTIDVIRGPERVDGWMNVITGVGTARDRQKLNTHTATRPIISDGELESLYLEYGLAGRIVDLLPEDMIREGFELSWPDMSDQEIAETQTKYTDLFDEVDFAGKVETALKWARLYGGSVLIIGAYDGQDLSKPLLGKKVKSISPARVIDRSDILYSNIRFQWDPNLERYGLPEQYPIYYRNQYAFEEEKPVHWSRVIEFHGVQLSEGTSILTEEQRYWGVSVLQKCYDLLGTIGTSFASIANLLDELTIGKYKLKNLADILGSPGGEDLVKQRIQTIDLMKSTLHSLYFDNEEDFVRETLAFNGVSDVLYQFFMLLSGATGYPITRLFGVSPAGMNATGESDQLNYYDVIKNKQRTVLKPIIRRYCQLFSDWKGLPMPGEINFVPLKQMTEKEVADMEYVKAQALSYRATYFNTLIQAGVIQPYQAQSLEFGDSLNTIPLPPEMEDLPPVELLPLTESQKTALIPPEERLAQGQAAMLEGQLAMMENVTDPTPEQQAKMEELRAQILQVKAQAQGIVTNSEPGQGKAESAEETGDETGEEDKKPRETAGLDRESVEAELKLLRAEDEPDEERIAELEAQLQTDNDETEALQDELAELSEIEEPDEKTKARIQELKRQLGLRMDIGRPAYTREDIRRMRIQCTQLKKKDKKTDEDLRKIYQLECRLAGCGGRNEGKNYGKYKTPKILPGGWESENGVHQG